MAKKNNIKNYFNNQQQYYQKKKNIFYKKRNKFNKSKFLNNKWLRKYESKNSKFKCSNWCCHNVN